ncbi:MAG: NUDIX domain-containing protein [Gammaproteobacteria bacterium]
MTEAVQRRLRQELRIGSDLDYLFKFQYRARYGEAGSENELCWVYAGVSSDRIDANRREVAEWRFIVPDALDRELAANPERFTPWFRLEWPRVRDALPGIVPDAA